MLKALKTSERFGEPKKVNKVYPLLFVLACIAAVGYGTAVSTTHSWDIGFGKFLPPTPLGK